MEEELYYWLSYADEGGFRGACIVKGGEFLEACLEAKRLGISPGGQVVGAGPFPLEAVSDWFKGKVGVLLQKEDMPDQEIQAMEVEAE